MPFSTPQRLLHQAHHLRAAPPHLRPRRITAQALLPCYCGQRNTCKSPVAQTARKLASAAFPPLLGFVLLIGMWSLISSSTDGAIPTPQATWQQAITVFSDPFYRNGPNDQGIGWNVLSSLQRVAMGFGLAALVGIPLGFVIGRFAFLSRMCNPIIGLLRPVSPWPGCPSVCWSFRVPTLPPSGPSSSAPSGPWSSTRPLAYSAYRRTT